MNLYVSISSVTAVLGVAVLSAAPALASGADELAARLGRIPPSHPRLFFSEGDEAALKAKIESDPLLEAAFERLQAGADATKHLDPVKREKVGKRLLGVSRTCLQRVSYLAFTHRMTRSENYVPRAQREMLAAAAFEDWNPSHFLDVAEMTAALAIGYDWLYNDLAPDVRKKIKRAIVEKGLRTSQDGGWWVATTNNWNQVCHGGLVLGALAVLDDEPELAGEIIARALKNVPRAMHEYEPDGVYPEGPGYWKYGTTYNVVLIAALESVLGTDFGLADSPAFMKTPEFYLHATGPTGLYFNFADCGTRGGSASAMHWFAARRKDPSLLWWERAELERWLAQGAEAGPARDRTLPFLLIWGQPIGDVPAPQKLHWKGAGPTPVAMHRSGWDHLATFVGIKGGSPSTNHAHMDTGSFVLDMDGVRWAIDLGAQSYHSLESKGINLWDKGQNSERWTVFRLNNLSHNTLVVDGQPQRVKGHAPIVGSSDDPEAPYTVVDMTPAYKGQLAQAHRGVRLVGPAVLVQDDLKTLDHETVVRWGMATHAEVTIPRADTATLKQDGRTLTLRILSPEGATFTVYDMENPPQDYDAKNPNTRMVGFEAAIDASAAETFAVFLKAGQAQSDTPTIIPLTDW